MRRNRQKEQEKEIKLVMAMMLATLALLSLVPRVKAEPTGQAGNFLGLGIGARALALGNAYTAVGDDPTASLWNPAGLSLLTHREMESMHTFLDLERDLNHFGFGLPLNETSTIGFNWSQYRIGSIPETSLDTSTQIGVDDNGDPIYDVKITGYFDDREDCLGVSYAYNLGNNLALGSTLKFFRNTVGNDSASALGVDLGFMFFPTNRFTLGLALRDLGENYSWNGFKGKDQKVPSTTALGLSFRPVSSLLLSGDVSKIQNRDVDFGAGAEYSFGETFQLRGGVLNGLVTAGLGLRISDWNIDYAYANRQVGVEHRLSSNYRFGLPVRKLQKGQASERGLKPYLEAEKEKQSQSPKPKNPLFAKIRTIGSEAASVFGRKAKQGLKRIVPAN
ncbi:MAG: PorV/PorQ family protein [bacterium]|jgi:hypothetical protein|nr:PorV/PorQ family protein [bacterium]